MEMRSILLKEENGRPILLAITGLSLALLPFGGHLGYSGATPYLIFWASSAAALLVAVTIAARCFAWEGVPDASIRIGVLVFAVVVVCGLVLGSAGRITPSACLALLAALATMCLFFDSPSWPMVPSQPTLAALPVPLVGLTAALVAFMVGFAMTHSPMTLYDSLSYHLYFPARWLQEHRLSIIPTPFSDEAQAYAPGNGELFFLWLMLPFHGDLVARAGQLPFGLLGAAAVFALARRLGASREHAAYPAVFFLLSRQVFEQALGANVDLICAAMFLTSLYLGILAADRDEARDWALWGVSLGLYCGTKYLALVYAPIFMLLAVAQGFRPKTLWAIPGVMAFALPWYLRNWLVAGSPIYPATLQIAGLTLARGAFDRGAMLNTVFHTNDLRLFPAMAAHALGPTLFLLWIPFALVGGASIIRRGWWPNGFVLLVPALMVPLYWFGSPVNIDSRFLLPGVGVALLPFAFAFNRSHAWNACVRAVYLLGILWVLVGLHASIPATLPWFMENWLVLNGLLQPHFLVAFVVAAIAMAAAWRLALSRPRWGAFSMAALVVLTAAALGPGGRWCPPHGCDSLDTTSPYVRPGLIESWQWLSEHTNHSVVAYTGINLPYPLFGDRLTNRVMYVNSDGHPRWRFHDYDRAYRDGRFVPESPALATSSGELRPVSQRTGPRDDAVRPRYERMEGFRDGWISNLQTFGVDRLFISSLSAYEIDYVWHNDGGFPIEDEWAKTDPRSFRLIYENPQVRIYEVALPAKTGA